jgi:predicted transcriptional regulator of viral defense system
MASDDDRRTVIDLLRERFGDRPFRVAEAIEAGASSSSVHRLRRGGQLESLGHGLLQFPGGGRGMLSGLAVVSARVPGGTICLNSSLSYWDLSDEIPGWVHLAVPRGAHRPVIDHPPTKVHVFDAGTFEREREQARTDAGEPFWIYSAERSVVDAIRLPRVVGRDVGLQALRRYLDRRGAAPARLAELARDLGGASRLNPALEALLS